MKPALFVAAAAFFAASASAQLVEPAAPALQRAPAQAFDAAFRPFPRVYGRNEAATPNAHLFQENFRTDPRLIGGVELFPYLSIEAGYVELFDRGFHRIDPGRPEDVSGALGVRGYSSHVAVRHDVRVTDDLTAFGKLGVAHSVRKTSGKGETDRGVYAGVGARYRVNERTTVEAQYGMHGNAAKWGSAANSTGLRGSVKMGF